MKRAKFITSAFIAVAILFASHAKAQSTNAMHTGDVWRFSIGGEAAIPTQNLYNFSSFAWGATGAVEYDFHPYLSFTLTSGYYDVVAKSYYSAIGNAHVTPSDAGIVPVKFGVKTFSNPNFYFQFELGPAFETNYAKNTKFDSAGGFGYMNRHNGLDISIRYEAFWGQGDDYGLVALRLAYSFGLTH